MNKSDPNGHISACACGVDTAVVVGGVVAITAYGYAQADVADDGELNGSHGKGLGAAIGNTVRSLFHAVFSDDKSENATSEINPEINEGMQGKHKPGHNNHDPDRSPIAENIDPGSLVAGAANGNYTQV